jgi:hypothetical protein
MRSLASASAKIGGLIPNFRQLPHGHGASACPDLKASPTRLNQGTPLTRERIEDAFQESQPFVFSLLATSRRQSVTRVEIERLLALHRVSVPHKCWLWKAMALGLVFNS